MKTNDQRRVLVSCSLCATAIEPVGSSLADIGPPVAIKLSANTAGAIAGEDYEGAFEIHIYQPGDLTDFRIEGEGWRVVSSTLRTASMRADVGIIRVTFRVVPAAADKPLGLSFVYNGRYVRTVFEVGPAHAARKAQSQWLTRIANTSGLRSAHAGETQTPGQPTPPAARGGAIPIRAVGRIVYDSPGIDRSDPADGDFDDPEDIAPASSPLTAIMTRVSMRCSTSKSAVPTPDNSMC